MKKLSESKEYIPLHEDLIEMLNESLSPNAVLSAAKPIKNYLNKKTSYKFFAYPELEEFESSELEGKGYGLRLYNAKNIPISIRFNFKSESPDFLQVYSLSIWIRNIQFNIKFPKRPSFVQILPALVSYLNEPKSAGTFNTAPEMEEADLMEEETLSEDTSTEDMIDGIIDMLSEPGFSKSKVYKAYRNQGYKVINALVKLYPNDITLQGTKYVFNGDESVVSSMKSNKEKIMAEAGVISGKIMRTSSVETYGASAEIEKIEDNADRLTFEEQLADMGNLLRLTISGAANACFIAGRGGVGKTYTAQQILAQAGLTDGDGYFLNKGSISSAGLYATLFEHKDGVIVFDDADDVFKDQTSRNLLKGATDTSATRKLNWNKMGSNVVDPDEMSDQEILDSGKIPKYFDFTGKIIFISNLKMDQLDPDGALRTRGYMISIDPTDEEVYDFMEKIVDKIKLKPGLFLGLEDRYYVVELLRKGTSKQTANLRKLDRGLNMLAGARKAGVNVSDTELERMISFYA